MLSHALALVLLLVVGSHGASIRRGVSENNHCVDDSSFESALGLSCSDHDSFSCEGLLKAGMLERNELDELLDKCPITCRVARCDKYLPATSTPQVERKTERVHNLLMKEERDLLFTFPSQDAGGACFVGWESSCQDDPLYVAPLGGLKCSDFANTQCVMFRHVGFTDVEMFDFINACPCSCGIECGEWTLAPTATPTVLASPSPSAAPTTPHPTSRPSAIPSVSPTKDVCVEGWENSCQDDESYVSPQGTDCATFKTLDCFLFDGIYDPDEWVELVNACPCSCNIECGTFTKSPSPIPSMAPSPSPPVVAEVIGDMFEVRMSPVSSLMDTMATITFQDTIKSMTIENLQMVGLDGVQIDFISMVQRSVSADVLSVTVQMLATKTVPAVGPGEPDPEYINAMKNLDNSAAMIFSLPTQQSFFISAVNEAPVLASVTSATYRNTTAI